MPRKLTPEQSAKIKALFRAALAIPEGIMIPKSTPSESESLKVLLFSEKKSWLTADPRFHAEIEHLTIRIEKDQRGNKIGVRIVPMADPTAGLEVYIAQAELSQKAKFVRPATVADCLAIERGEVYGPLDAAIAQQKAKQAGELTAIEKDLEDRLRSLGLAQDQGTQTGPAFDYSSGESQ